MVLLEPGIFQSVLEVSQRVDCRFFKWVLFGDRFLVAQLLNDLHPGRDAFIYLYSLNNCLRVVPEHRRLLVVFFFLFAVSFAVVFDRSGLEWRLDLNQWVFDSGAVLVFERHQFLRHGDPCALAE